MDSEPLAPDTDSSSSTPDAKAADSTDTAGNTAVDKPVRSRPQRSRTASSAAGTRAPAARTPAGSAKSTKAAVAKSSSATESTADTAHSQASAAASATPKTRAPRTTAASRSRAASTAAGGATAAKRAPAAQPRATSGTTPVKPRAPRKTAAQRAAEEAAKVATAPDASPQTTADVDAPRAATVDETVDTLIAQKPAQAPNRNEVVLSISGLVKRFGDTIAVAGIDLDVHAGSFFGIVGPNGAGKTTTLSMVTGLLRPDAGSVTVHGIDVWKNPEKAKRAMGVLPDRLRLFDRLTGSQLLYYSGTLRGLDRETVLARTADLAKAFGFTDALGRLVTDYSAGMSKKIALAAAMIHSPRLLVLDEPFESVDPVSAANVTEILRRYVAAGGTVVLSSHSMDLIQRICDSVAVVVNGAILAAGTMAEVRDGKTLEERFVELAGGRTNAEGMEWLHSFSD